MIKHSSFNSGKSKATVFIILLVCLLFSVTNIFSQKLHGKHPTIIAFNSTDATSHVTYDQLLANPDIICKETDCSVTGFTISFLPKGKDFSGPYKTEGSNRVQGKALTIIKELKESGNQNTRVFIENIIVKYNGKYDTITQGIAFLCTPK